MKKLLKVSIKVWAFVGLIIASAIITATIILKMKIETIYKVDAKVSNRNKAELILDSKTVYLLEKGDKVILRINDKDIESTLDNVRFDEKLNSFVAMLEDVPKELIPNTTLPIEIIYNHERVMDVLLSPGV